MKELLSLLRPSSQLFRMIIENFTNDSFQFYFPFDRIPKCVIFDITIKNQSTPKIINQININQYKKDIVVNMFQYFFFAFGLFPDHLVCIFSNIKINK